MEVKELSSWAEFENELNGLTRELALARFASNASSFLFRGQADAGWSLDTTLDRRLREPVKYVQYMQWVSAAKPQIESLANERWNKLPSGIELLEMGTNYDKLRFNILPTYEYLIYLRHHGFPSPLLDWTRSPYIAAFFAFRAIEANEVAIYCYQEMQGGGKTSSSAEPQIFKFGPYVTGHPRHHTQQSEYTCCMHFDDGHWYFVPHENVFSQESTTQDVLRKYVLPAELRDEVLKRLDAHNLNAFSLFGTNEALLEAIALREIEFSSD